MHILTKRAGIDYRIISIVVDINIRGEINVILEIGTLLSKIEVISRGFVYMKDSESLIEEVRTLAARTVDECFEKGVMDLNTVRSKVKEAVSSKLYSRTKKRPMVMPILLDIGL